MPSREGGEGILDVGIDHEDEGSANALVMGGDDMAPSISPRESLRIAKVHPSAVRLGDVVVFKRYIPIAHRVVGRFQINRRWYFVTKGDRCPYVDSPVDEGMVLGTVAGKSLPVETSAIKRAAFAFLLLWYIPATRLLRGRTFRRVNFLARRFASLDF